MTTWVDAGSDTVVDDVAGSSVGVSPPANVGTRSGAPSLAGTVSTRPGPRDSTGRHGGRRRKRCRERVPEDTPPPVVVGAHVEALSTTRPRFGRREAPGTAPVSVDRGEAPRRRAHIEVVTVAGTRAAGTCPGDGPPRRWVGDGTACATVGCRSSDTSPRRTRCCAPRTVRAQRLRECGGCFT